MIPFDCVVNILLYIPYDELIGMNICDLYPGIMDLMCRLRVKHYQYLSCEFTTIDDILVTIKHINNEKISQTYSANETWNLGFKIDSINRSKPFKCDEYPDYSAFDSAIDDTNHPLLPPVRVADYVDMTEMDYIMRHNQTSIRINSAKYYGLDPQELRRLIAMIEYKPKHIIFPVKTFWIECRYSVDRFHRTCDYRIELSAKDGVLISEDVICTENIKISIPLLFGLVVKDVGGIRQYATFSVTGKCKNFDRQIKRLIEELDRQN
jgi:hypothetical protein